MVGFNVSGLAQKVEIPPTVVGGFLQVLSTKQILNAL
jgi:hypothetical protein